jgi:uncharacterized membrane protein
MTFEAIRSVPLFASLDDRAAGRLRDLLTRIDVPAGAVLFRTGDHGEAMYLIEGGRIAITVTEDGETVTLAELGQGDYFGEMALLDGLPRSADAHAVADARLAVLSRDDFRRLILDNPAVALEMLTATFSRLRLTGRMLHERVSRNANVEDAKRLTMADRAADMIAAFGGSWMFIGASLLFLTSWMILNTWIMRASEFDPFPYVLLNLVLGVITSLQAPLILMSQNRQSEKDRLRADLDYRVNLKNELALTEVLRRLDVLESERLPLLFEQQNARLLARPGRDAAS